MKIQQLFEVFLDLHNPFHVEKIEVRDTDHVVDIHIEMDRKATVKCPTCGRECGRYDHRTTTWRHLDLFEYMTFIHCEMPRVNCPEHGVLSSHAPWEDGCTSSKFFGQIGT